MMISVLFLWCLVAAATEAFRQSDYEVTHHRLELISYNHNYVSNVKASMVPFNRTSRALNLTFDLLMDLNANSIPMTFQIHRLSMTDYRLLPVHLDMDYCKMRKENTFGINDIAHHANVTHCPIKKGRYYVDKYRPDESKFPPHALPGDYKLVIKFMYASEQLSEAHWYGAVKQVLRI